MKNKFNKDFALELDLETEEQFTNCVKHDFVKKSVLMPDAHKGYVAPIGSVLVTEKKIVPSWVGYDIGCGVIALFLEKKNIKKLVKEKSKEIFKFGCFEIPMGKGKINKGENITQKTKDEYLKFIKKLESKVEKNQLLNFIKNGGLLHLGSLGSGNHFIEIGETEKEDEIWLIIHSGSRGVGHKIAEYFMKSARGNNKGNFEETFALDNCEKLGIEYLNYMDFALDFALLNRLEIANKVEEIFQNVFRDKNLKFKLWCNKHHNHIEFEKDQFIHRKGATPAKKKERGVIPANMRDGCFLIEGLGSKDFLESSSHGAGRKLSRTKAKQDIKLEDFKKNMKGIVGKVDLQTIDESPQAYKDIYEVMEKQKASVKILKHIKPIINWKG